MSQLCAPQTGVLHQLVAIGLQRNGVYRLLVAARRLSLLGALEWKLAEPAGETGRAEAVLPGTADAAIHASQGAHNCRQKEENISHFT